MAELLPALTPDDYAALAYVADVRISPDGERVAYVVRRMDVEANEYRSAIWVTAADGQGEAVRLTPGERQDSAPRWSPDGRTIAYLSDAGEAPSEGGAPGAVKKPPKQLHTVPADGGEARRMSSFGDGCGDPAWTPAGDALVVVVKEERQDPQVEDAPRVYDRIRYKSDEGGLFDLRRRHLWIVPVDGGAPRRLTDGDWDDSAPAVSPDGRWVAFASNRSGERDRNTVSDIWTVAVDGGEAARVTDERGTYRAPSWSPDGTRIACIGIPVARGAGAENQRVWSFAADGGAGRDLLGTWDRTAGSTIGSDMRSGDGVSPVAWSSDGTRLYCVGTDRGSAHLYELRAEGAQPRPLTGGDQQVVSFSVDLSARRFAALRTTASEPGDAVVGNIGDEPAALRRLTRLNDELLASRWIGAPERIEARGADGWPIDGWLIRPRGFDETQRWPLVLEIHGGPHSSYGHAFMLEFQVLAGRGYAVLYTNPRGSHGYGAEFVAACVGDWGGRDMQDLLAAVDHVTAQGWVDTSRLYVTGGSYGGFMTNWIVGHDQRFRAAVTQRSISNNISAFGTSDIGFHFWHEEHGATPWDRPERLVERSPLTYVQDIRTPLLLLHGENDLRCPIEQAEQLFVALKALGREAVFVRYQRDNHEVTRSGKPRNRIDHCRRIADWFDSHQ